MTLVVYSNTHFIPIVQLGVVTAILLNYIINTRTYSSQHPSYRKQQDDQPTLARIHNILCVANSDDHLLSDTCHIKLYAQRNCKKKCPLVLIFSKQFSLILFRKHF